MNDNSFQQTFFDLTNNTPRKKFIQKNVDIRDYNFFKEAKFYLYLNELNRMLIQLFGILS